MVQEDAAARMGERTAALVNNGAVVEAPRCSEMTRARGRRRGGLKQHSVMGGVACLSFQQGKMKSGVSIGCDCVRASERYVADPEE